MKKLITLVALMASITSFASDIGSYAGTYFTDGMHVTIESNGDVKLSGDKDRLGPFNNRYMRTKEVAQDIYALTDFFSPLYVVVGESAIKETQKRCGRYDVQDVLIFGVGAQGEEYMCLHQN